MPRQPLPTAEPKHGAASEFDHHAFPAPAGDQMAEHVFQRRQPEQGMNQGSDTSPACGVPADRR